MATPAAEPHTISTPTRALVDGAVVGRAAAKPKPKPKPTVKSKTPAKVKTTKGKPKPGSRVAKPASASKSSSSSTAAQSALSSATSGLLGGNLATSLLGTQTDPSTYDQSLINQLIAQGKTQLAAMQASASAAEKAGAQWSNDSAANLSNLAKIAGQGGTAPGTYLGDLSANQQALPGVMSQQDLLQSVSGAAQAENQAGMIPGQIAQTALTNQGLFYGAQEKALSSLQQELAKNQTAMSDAQLAAASRILAAQITATGGIDKSNIASTTAITDTNTNAAAKSATTNNSAYQAALKNVTAAWEGQAASGSKTAVPGIQSMTPANQATSLLRTVQEQNISPAQRWQILSSRLSDSQLQYLQYKYPAYRSFSGYSKQLSQAQNYVKQLKKTVTAATSPAGQKAAKAKIESQISALEKQINALPGTIQAVGQRATLQAQINKLNAQINNLGQVPQSLITSAFTKLAPAIGGNAAEDLMTSVFGHNALYQWAIQNMNLVGQYYAS